MTDDNNYNDQLAADNPNETPKRKAGRPPGTPNKPGSKRPGHKPGQKKGGRPPGSPNKTTRSQGITYDGRLVTVNVMHKIFRKIGGIKAASDYYEGNAPANSKIGEFLKIYLKILPEREMAILQTQIAHELDQKEGSNQQTPQLTINLTKDKNNNDGNNPNGTTD